MTEGNCVIRRWQQGRPEVERLLAERRIERVPASRELAELMLAQSDAHLRSARALAHTDVVGAFQLAYDAARKSLAAILVNQGLRAKGPGAHAVLLEVVLAQLHPPLGPVFSGFDWMRRLRNTSEYPDTDTPVAEVADVVEATPVVGKMIAAAKTVIEEMPAY